MELRQLRYFVTVADCGSVTEAARVLHMSQPPLSIQLRQLEQEVGCTLLDRTTRHLELTDAGQTLYRRARTVLEQCESARRELRDVQAGAAGTLRLGVVSSVCPALLPALLAAFSAAYPAIRIELTEGDTYRLLDKLRSDQVEAALIRTPFRDAQVQTLPLGQEPLCLVGTPEQLAGLPVQVTPVLLAGRPLILYRRWEALIRDALTQADVPARVICLADDARTAVSLAMAGIGIAVAPRGAAVGLPPAQVRELDVPALRSDIVLAVRREGYRSPAARQFWQFIQEREATK